MPELARNELEAAAGVRLRAKTGCGARQERGEHGGAAMASGDDDRAAEGGVRVWRGGKWIWRGRDEGIGRIS